MGRLVTIRELSELVEIKESKIRRWTKKGILTPVSVSSKDGKSLLYHLDCVKVKLEILERIRIDFNDLSEIGAVFQKVFGRRDSDLREALQRSENRKELIRKYLEEIRELANQ